LDAIQGLNLPFQLTDIIDILIVAFIIYKAIMFTRRTSSFNLALGIFLVLIALWLSDVFGLVMINYALKKMVELGLIALVILFQPELRRALTKVGGVVRIGKVSSNTIIETAIAQIVLACEDMSSSKTGALIIFERNQMLNDIINTGTIVNSDVVAELIKNIFYNKAPLHDGAMIVRNGRIAAAGCVLPLTKNTNLSKELGMRHRAGIGMSENYDAVVVIVSEETGAISFAEDGMLKRHLTPSMLDKQLRSALILEEDENNKLGIIARLKKAFGGLLNDGDK